jgi:hypothetical protein
MIGLRACRYKLLSMAEPNELTIDKVKTRAALGINHGPGIDVEFRIVRPQLHARARFPKPLAAPNIW